MKKKTTRDRLQAIADKVGGSVYERYSGRGMFGDTCWGIVCPHSAVKEVIRATKGFGKACTDEMGLDAIVYWPFFKEQGETESGT
jgi:hypothetical protein